MAPKSLEEKIAELNQQGKSKWTKKDWEKYAKLLEKMGDVEQPKVAVKVGKKETTKASATYGPFLVKKPNSLLTF